MRWPLVSQSVNSAVRFWDRSSRNDLPWGFPNLEKRTGVVPLSSFRAELSLRTGNAWLYSTVLLCPILRTFHKFPWEEGAEQGS